MARAAKDERKRRAERLSGERETPDTTLQADETLLDVFRVSLSFWCNPNPGLQGYNFSKFGSVD